MHTFSINMSGSRPIIQLNGLPALIASGFTIPLANFTKEELEKDWNAVKALENVSFSDNISIIRGDVYTFHDLHVGDIQFSEINMLVPHNPFNGGYAGFKFVLSNSIFAGMNLSFNGPQNLLEIEMPDIQSRKAIIKNDEEELYVEVIDTPSI